MLKLTLTLLSLLGLTLEAQNSLVIPEIGVVQDLENDDLIYDYGISYLTENTQKILSPRRVSEKEFSTWLRAIDTLQTDLYATNLFIPGELKVVGPQVNEAAVLGYVDTVFQRAELAGLTLITWGSCGSRRLPQGFSRVIATAQFVDIARKVAQLAEKYNLLLALENLNTSECNFINSLSEATAVVKAVNHPNLRLCVDIYHMLVDEEPASSIAGTGPYAIYCELAEREGRTPPGTHGDDFTPYLRALKREGYQGIIAIECRWKNLEMEGEMAFRTLREQIEEAYR